MEIIFEYIRKTILILSSIIIFVAIAVVIAATRFKRKKGYEIKE